MRGRLARALRIQEVSGARSILARPATPQIGVYPQVSEMSKAPVGIIIDGQMRPSVAGRTFEKRNPATGELVSILCEGDAADIDLAVAAARRG